METEKKKVLLVEDDAAIRGAVLSLLERHGYQVQGVSDGDEALKVIEDVDIVLLDIFLPKFTGDELLKRIRGRGNYVPVVLMSAMPESEARECFEEFKVVDFVSKPFKSKDLMEKVDRAAAIAEDMKVVRHSTDRLKGFINRQAAL